MGDRKTLQIQQISAHPGPVAGEGMQRQEQVCKLIDTTTCIGCKACEVACVEWNDMPFQQTMFDNTYQTMPDTDWNYWNLIKFNESEHSDGSFAWLMRKHQCMHCADPGCLRACPADGAIVQYANGIVDFQQENCIGCQFCVSGCPFNIPKFNPIDQEGLQVHAVLGPRRSGSGARLHQGVSYGMFALRHQRRHEVPRREARDAASRRVRFCQGSWVYDPDTIGGTHVIYVLHDITKPEKYGNLPAKPRIPLSFTIWKNVFKPIGLFGAMLGFVGVVMHYVFEGPRREQPTPPIKQIDPPQPPARKEN